MYGAIKHYMSIKGKEFLNPLKEDLFIVLCQSVNEICEKNVTKDSIDRNGIIDDTYKLIYPLFDSLIKSNLSLTEELEKQVKYGTRITLTSEELKNLL